MRLLLLGLLMTTLLLHPAIVEAELSARFAESAKGVYGISQYDSNINKRNTPIYFFNLSRNYQSDSSVRPVTLNR